MIKIRVKNIGGERMSKVVKSSKKKTVVPIVLGLVTIGTIIGTIVVKNKKTLN